MTYVEPQRAGVRLESASASAAVFAFFMLLGSGYIVSSKLIGLPAFWLVFGPVALLLVYAILLGFARYLRLRDDQAGDNLYYVGFLYTLTSLGVSLWLFSSERGSDTIVTNFGIAISSTIVGITLRVAFNQLRQDPMEVERTARLQLADAARRVRQELDAMIFELQSFRRAAQQSFEESLVETKEYSTRVIKTVFEDLEKLPERSAAPIQTASLNTKEAITRLADELGDKLKKSGDTLTDEENRLSNSAAGVREALSAVEQRLRSMQTPEGIIEVKLQPFISGLTKAINSFSAIAERQANSDQERHDQLKAVVSDLRSGVIGLTERQAAADNERLQQFKAAVSELRSGIAGLADRLGATAADSSATQKGLAEQLSVIEALQRNAVSLFEKAPAAIPPGGAPNPNGDQTSGARADRGWFTRGAPNVRP